MRERLFYLFKIYGWFLIVFMLQKPIFMLYHYSLYATTGFSEWIKVIWHGLPLDLSIGGYLMVLPVIITLCSVWVQGRWLVAAYKVYFILISFLLAVIFVCDAELYSYWGFRLDATPLFYLKSPADAAASVPLLAMILVPLCIVIYFLLIIYPLFRWSGSTGKWRFFKKRVRASLCFVLILGLLFIPIRGGFSVSTMNVGKVYFSSDMLLNHAAINPAFSLMTSLSREQDFGEQYRFFSDREATDLFQELYPGETTPDRADTLIKQRPDILFIVLESFSATLVEDLGGETGVTPNLSRLAKEGILFTNFYANSFRTDRGLVSVLSGYPAQPNTSIMKYPAKSQSLPSISKTLKGEGYDIEFLYGGDADFTNMRSYFVSAGFDRIVSDQDFPVKDRLSKWGANDAVGFDRLTALIKEQKQQPFMKLFLTLSSHEPFDVPYKKYSDPYVNSVAYTDSCLGVFVSELKKSPQWDNTLLVLLPDHAFRYPYTLSNFEPQRHHIPMIWAGGAVLKRDTIDVYGSQIDLAATLLSQMQLPHAEFAFSKNMLDPALPKFAWYSFNNGFGYVDQYNQVVYDCDAGRVLESSGNQPEKAVDYGKSFLQKLFDDLARR